MALPTLPPDLALATLKDDEDNFSRSKLEANPLTVALAVPFTNFINTVWQPAFLLESQLDYDQALASARIHQADRVLNTLVKKVDTTLLLITNKDRTAPLYVQFFSHQRPFEVAAGLLGPQLETMRGWLPLLQASSHASLAALGTEIAVAIKDADAAVAAKKAAENAILVFQTTGDRRKAIDEYNVLRKVTYGELGKLQIQNADLPTDFADSFFRHDSKRSDDKMSPEQLQQKIDALTTQLHALQDKLKAALARQTADAEKKAADEQLRIEIEAKKEERDQLDSAIKKLESDLRK